MKSRFRKWLLRFCGLVVVVYLALLVPTSSPPPVTSGEQQSFQWNRDSYWSYLEARFDAARQGSCVDLAPEISLGFRRLDSLVARLGAARLNPDSPLFAEIEREFFELGALVAACPQSLGRYAGAFGNLRRSVKEQSLPWEMNSTAARDCLYRILYGGRIAIEEAMLQALRPSIPELLVETEEKSDAPSAVVRGLRVHSGDILVSRGGAPTSALIARGSDYPGNFSHAALVYVDDATGEVSIIEAHIECGLVVSTVADYLKDTKLRIMVLRLRADLPEVLSDPLLAHRAAGYALRKAGSEHIAYDFAMDSEDHSRLFCSEVVAEAYQQVGIRLWQGMSHISEPGVRSWLSAFGVRSFTTQEPSDLEYDPQLCVVAEWRDHHTLLKDRMDNAVVDVMLESAEQGDRLEYDLYLLPLARMAKAYSFALNQFGALGPVPEGMSAVAALRNHWFSRRHEETVEKLLRLVQVFEAEKQYAPPYWQLVKLAREAYSS